MLAFILLFVCATTAVQLHTDQVESCRVSPNSVRVACIMEGGDGLSAMNRDGSGTPITLVADLEMVTGGEIDRIRWAGNTHIVFQGDVETDSRSELFSVPADGSASFQRISGDLAGLGANVQDDWMLTPDGSRAVYRADQDTVGQFELYSVPVDGSAAEVELNQAMPATGDVEFFDVTNIHGFFVARDSVTSRDHLWSAPLDGSAAATDLSPSITVVTESVQAFGVSPDGTRVAYYVNGASDIREAHVSGGYETLLHGTSSADTILWTPDGSTVVWCGGTIWAAPSNTTGSAVQQTPQSGTINRCELSPNGVYVVWFGDLETTNVDELWSSAVNTVSAPTPVKLNGVMNANGDVHDFLISLDSSQVIYNADQVANNMDQIFYGPIGGPAASFALFDSAFEGRCENQGPPTPREGWSLSPDGTWLVCIDFFQLYRSINVPGTMEFMQGSVSEFFMSPDSTGLVYVAGNYVHGLLLSSGSPTTGGSTSPAARLQPFLIM